MKKGLKTEASIRAAARKAAQAAIEEAAAKCPDRIVRALQADPDLLRGVQDLDHLAQVLAEAGQQEGLAALLHDRRTPGWARRIIASALLAAPA